MPVKAFAAVCTVGLASLVASAGVSTVAPSIFIAPNFNMLPKFILLIDLFNASTAIAILRNSLPIASPSILSNPSFIASTFSPMLRISLDISTIGPAA